MARQPIINIFLNGGKESKKESTIKRKLSKKKDKTTDIESKRHSELLKALKSIETGIPTSTHTGGSK